MSKKGFSTALGAAYNSLAAHWRLTPREAEILRMIVAGQSSSTDLSQAMQVTTATVNRHLEAICMKSGLQGRKEIISFLMRIYDRLLQRVEDEFVRARMHRNVFIVDDDEDLSQVLSRYLVQAGFQVRTNFEEPKFMERAAEIQTPNIVVYDLSFPYKSVSGLFLACETPAPLVTRVAMTGNLGYLESHRSLLTWESLLMKPFNQVEAVNCVVDAALTHQGRDLVSEALRRQ